MTFDLEEYQRLKRKADEAQKQADKAKWEREQLMKQLKTEYDCSTLKEAEKLLKTMEDQLQDAEKDYDQAKREFLDQWEGD